MDCSSIFGTRKWLVDCQVFILEYDNKYYSHTSLHILRSNSLCLEEAGSVWKVSDGNSWKYDHQVTVTCIGETSSPSGANVEHEDHQEKVLDMKTLTIIVLASLLILTSLALIGVVIWSRRRRTASASEQETRSGSVTQPEHEHGHLYEMEGHISGGYDTIMVTSEVEKC